MNRVRVALIALWLAVVACGVPLDPVPEVVEGDVGAPDPEVEELEADDRVAASLYLVDEGVIVPVTRNLPEPVNTITILESLLGGTTEPEERRGLRTSIPDGTQVLDLEQNDSTVRLDLSSDFAAVGGEEELLAVAQVVLSVTAVEGVEAVVFELEGVQTDVPLPNGALTDEPVSGSEYRGLSSR